MEGGRLPSRTECEGVNRLEWVFVGLVFAHLAAVLVHTVAHLALQILPGPADTVFIVVVIMVAPVASLPILRFNRPLASGLLAVVMAAAFAYGVQGHYLVSGPDNVTIIASDPWTLVFVVTGAVLGVLQVASVIVAAIVFSRSVRTPSGPGEQPG